MGIKIEGIEQLQRNLETFKGEAKDIVVAAIFEGCRLIQNEAKLAHEPGAHNIGRYVNRTTHLTQSIQAEKPIVTNEKIRGEVVAAMDYASSVELGGTYTTESGRVIQTRPYPFLFPAFEKYKSAINDGIVNLLRAIKWIN